MAKRCINPQCDEQSSYFGAGALYVLDRRNTSRSPRHTEYFWLCVSCAAHFTMQTDGVGNVVVIPRARVSRFVRGDATGNLGLVFRSTGVSLPTDNSIWKHSDRPNTIPVEMIGGSGKARAAESIGH
jgi:hypothetical protein